MKRWPAFVSFLLFSVLCASAAYWAMQLFKPAVRPVAATPQTAKIDYSLDAATGLFGGRKMAALAVASNYALKGVVVSLNPRDSIAILATDGKPAQAIRVGSAVSRGVTVQEVHRQYVLLSEGGVSKRVPLPENAAPQVNVGVPGNPPIPAPIPNQANPLAPIPDPAIVVPPQGAVPEPATPGRRGKIRGSHDEDN